MPKKKKSPISLRSYILISVLLDVVSVFLIFPQLFETPNPLFSVHSLIILFFFCLWGSIQAYFGYRITRG